MMRITNDDDDENNSSSYDTFSNDGGDYIDVDLLDLPSRDDII